MTPFAAGQPTGITIHHSLTEDSTSLALAAIKRYHVEVNRWEDIGYHRLIEMVGDEARILSARSTAYQGAHCPELNATHLGVCVVGNFDDDVPSEKIFRTLVRCCIALMIEYPHITPQSINFHCDHSSKTCPGRLFPKTAFLLAVSDRYKALGLHFGRV